MPKDETAKGRNGETAKRRECCLFTDSGNHGRGCGVGRTLGIGLPLGVGVGRGVEVAVAVGVGVGVAHGVSMYVRDWFCGGESGQQMQKSSV